MLRRGLPRQARLPVQPIAVVLGRLVQVGVERKCAEIADRAIDEHVADIRVGSHVTHGRVKPQAVLADWPAEARIEVAVHLDRVWRPQPERPQVIIEIVPGHRVVGEAAENDAAESVASISRNDIRPHAAFGCLGRDRRCVDDNFLNRARVHNPKRFERFVCPTSRQPVQVLPVISALAAVDRKNGGRVTAGATNFLRPESCVVDCAKGSRHARDQHTEARRQSTRGQ